MAHPDTTAEDEASDVQLDAATGDDAATRSLVEVVAPWMRSDRAMLGTLGVLAVGWAIVLGRLIVLRHDRFATFDFDEGIQDQLIWQLAHLRQFTTVRGVPFLGNHASFGFVLLAPLVWLGAGPNTWNVLNAVALAGCAPILYLIARDRLGRPWIGLVVGVVWLAQPSVQWWVQEGFHPECVALPFLFATWLFGERIAKRLAEGLPVERRLRWQFAASFLATIIWKEDLALALVGMGLVWLIRRRWKLGLRVVAVAALWFAIFGAWMVPHFAGGTVYGGIYGDLGATPSAVVTTSISQPSRLAKRLGDNDALRYSRRLHQSYGFVSVLSPVTWLIGAPQWMVDITSTAYFTWDPMFHYQTIPTAALAISFIEGVALLMRRRRWLGETAVLVGLCSALWCGHVYGPGPWSNSYRAGFWPLRAGPNQAANEAAVARVGPSDGVSADYLVVPHLTHRRFVYTFPNPWRNSNYGIEPSDHGDPAKVRWIVMDTAMLNEADSKLYAEVEASGEFRMVMHQGTIEVLQRVHPPGKGTHPITVP
jgi:uncharacterized membrane protein